MTQKRIRELETELFEHIQYGQEARAKWCAEKCQTRIAEQDKLLRDAYKFTKYAAAAFAYEEKGSGTPEWFEGLREQIEALQPRLEIALQVAALTSP